MTKLIRQGDVLLQPIPKLPEGAVPDAPGTVPSRVVLAYGEATGHHHSIALAGGRVCRFRDEAGGFYLQVTAGSPVALEHQEHSTIMLDPGVYKLPTQVEYTPSELVRVAD